MNLLEVIISDLVELSELSENNVHRRQFLKSRIQETIDKIECGILEEKWDERVEKAFHSAKTGWQKYLMNTKQISTGKFSAKADIPNTTYERRTRLKKTDKSQLKGKNLFK